MIANLIDRLAGMWLNLRAQRAARKDKNWQDLMVHSVEVNDKGIAILADHPIVAMFADEAAAFLGKFNAKNYVEFELMPRADRGLKPVRVTVQWSNRFSPSQKADRLQQALEKIANSHDIQAEYAAKEDWHGLYNWAQDVAKDAIAAVNWEPTP